MDARQLDPQNQIMGAAGGRMMEAAAGGRMLEAAAGGRMRRVVPQQPSSMQERVIPEHKEVTQAQGNRNKNQR